jgi:hypothetical protein
MSSTSIAEFFSVETVLAGEAFFSGVAVGSAVESFDTDEEALGSVSGEDETVCEAEVSIFLRGMEGVATGAALWLEDAAFVD